MEIKRLKKALEEREASGFDGFEGSGGGGGMRIATITAVARAFNNASRRQQNVPSQGESCLQLHKSPVLPISLSKHSCCFDGALHAEIFLRGVRFFWCIIDPKEPLW